MSILHSINSMMDAVEQLTKDLKLDGDIAMEYKDKPSVVLLSAYKAQYDDRTNAQAEAELIDRLTELGFGFKETEGCYEGVTEPSFAVVLKTNDQLKTLLSLAKDFEQDSILHVDRTRKGHIIKTDGTVVGSGRFVCVGTERPRGDWTHDMLTGYYYKLI